jgi:hypothetical protein
LFDATKIFSDADPTYMHVLARIGIMRALRNERPEFLHCGLKISHLQPAGIEERERDALLRDFTRVLGDGTTLARSRHIALEHRIDQSAFSDPGTACDENIDMASFSKGFMQGLFRQGSDVDVVVQGGSPEI